MGQSSNEAQSRNMGSAKGYHIERGNVGMCVTMWEYVIKDVGICGKNCGSMWQNVDVGKNLVFFGSPWYTQY